MKKAVRWAFGVIFAILAAGFLVWAFVHSRKESATEPERERPVRAPSRVSKQDDQIVISLDASAQAKNGIRVETLRATTHRAESRANSIVLSPQELIGQRDSYLPAMSEVEKAKASVEVSKREYERLKTLYTDDQNASAKALQAAEGTWRSDEASLRAAQGSLSLNRNMVRQSWGDVVSSWVFDGSPAFDRLATQRDVLLQVVLPAPRSSRFAPQSGVLQLPDGKLLSAKLVSAFPRVDPRIQSPTYLYVAVAQPDLIPGMNLVFLLPSGAPMRGVLVPSSAVVWWQGKAWAYVQIERERFSRREVPTSVPVNGGWFATKEFAPGDRIVIAGGQQLLSEEFRSQIQVLGEESENQ